MYLSYSFSGFDHMGLHFVFQNKFASTFTGEGESCLSSISLNTHNTTMQYRPLADSLGLMKSAIQLSYNYLKGPYHMV